MKCGYKNEIVNIMELNKPLTKVNLNQIAVLIATMKSTNY